MIRRATVEDVDRIVEMGVRFIETTVYRDLIPMTERSRWMQRDFVAALVDGPVQDASVVFVAEKDGACIGMIGAFVYVSPLTAEREGIETFFWIEPEHRGGRLFRDIVTVAEAWAKANGAIVFRMVAPTDKVSKLYERLDYRPISTDFVKRL